MSRTSKIHFTLKMCTFLKSFAVKNPPNLQNTGKQMEVDTKTHIHQKKKNVEINSANGFCEINFKYTNTDAVQTYLIQ